MDKLYNLYVDVVGGEKVGTIDFSQSSLYGMCVYDDSTSLLPGSGSDRYRDPILCDL